ncbi:hypothetical protein PpBr36_01453 [Pyricularia pennisetigena]|uniref:hypothetical protein n=1 Tax=Pyricularia pennisetigena TaxID=1578925 RepID=UPI0011515FC7|nr:hypothetical protein PpBr36_01453 [Pyricularia pennisetigena]TLS29707.1 hypothetical protein PpBr36_01453 [Pyricularia pennisetigena]
MMTAKPEKDIFERVSSFNKCLREQVSAMVGEAQAEELPEEDGRTFDEPVTAAAAALDRMALLNNTEYKEVLRATIEMLLRVKDQSEEHGRPIVPNDETCRD